MAQRNPMNERYTGEGPSGQTRKSAASAKPKSSAASSVYIKKKPQTPQEKRAAAKAREKEMRARAEEKARKAEEKAKLAAQESGEETEATKATQQKTPMVKLTSSNPGMPTSEEYQKWRKRYWALVIVGVVCIALSFIMQMNGMAQSPMTMVILAVAYPAIIGALIIDFRKVKPLIRAHQGTSSGNKSPKQLKHEQEAKEQAAAMEAARKAAKASKRKLIRRKKDDVVTTGAPDVTEDAEKVEAINSDKK